MVSVKPRGLHAAFDDETDYKIVFLHRSEY